MSKKRDTTHHARLLHTKMPLFLQTNAMGSAMTRTGAGPPSGTAKSVRSSLNEEIPSIKAEITSEQN